MTGQKKLDDYLKELDSYAKADAQQKKKEYEASFHHKFVFPWTKVIFFSLMAFGFYKGPSKELVNVVLQMPQVRAIAETGVKYSGLKIQLPPVEGGAVNSGHNVTIQIDGSQSHSSMSLQRPEAPQVQDEEEAGASAVPKSDMVKVEGRWMKRRADNIYIIDGRKVLYIDDRKR